MKTKKIILIGFICIFMLVIETGGVHADTFEPDDTIVDAKVIAVGNSFQEREIDYAGDIDWISFEAVEGHGYVIELAGETGGDVIFEMYNGHHIALSTTVFSTRTEWVCPVSGTYYLKISENGNDYTAAYTIRVLPAFWNGTVAWDTMDHEPDDTQYRSRPVKTDGTLYHYANLNPADRDWVRFTAKAGVDYRFTLSNEINGNYYFRVNNAFGSVSSTQNTTWTWTCLITGTYYVMLWENNRDHSGEFDFSITAGEEDNSVDIYNRDVTLYTDAAYGTVAATLVATSSNCSDQLQWNSSDTSVVTVDANGHLDAVAVGRTVVTVTCQTDGSSDQAVVRVNADDYEDNDTLENAKPIDIGPLYQRHHLKSGGETPDQVDWISFEAIEGNGYVIELSDEIGNTQFRLYDENEATIFTGPASEERLWTCSRSGTYYIRCWAYSNRWASYSIRILPAYWNGTAAWDQEYEPDNNRYRAPQVRTDGTVYHYVNSDPTSWDWVRFTAKVGVTYTFTLSDEAGGDFRFQVHSDTRNLSGGQTTAWTWTCFITGTYYIGIWESGNDSLGTVDFSISSDSVEYTIDIQNDDIALYADSGYGATSCNLRTTSSNCSDAVEWNSSDELIATVSEDGSISAAGAGRAVITARCPDDGSADHITVVVNTDDYEDNDSLAAAKPIGIGPLYQHHQLDPIAQTPDRFDWLRFEAIEGNGYAIELSGETGGDVYLRLYDENETPLYSGVTAEQSWMCPRSGTYYIRCNENGNNHWAHYNIRVLPAYWNGSASWNADFEPDSSRYLSPRIRTDGTVYHHINLNPADVDWVRFTAKEGVAYTFTLSNEIHGDYLFQVYDEVRNFISHSSTSTWNCPVTGTYYIRFRENSGDHIGMFDFSISSDTAERSVDIQNKSVTLYADAVYGATEYRLRSTSSNCDDSIQWVSSADSIVTVDANGQIAAASPGRAVITATCPTDASADQISVTVNVDDYENNDTLENAAPIDVGPLYQHHKLSPASDTPDQYDWVRFEAIEGNGYVIELADEAGGDVYFRLFDENEVPIFSNTTTTQSWTCPRSGKYYVRCWVNASERKWTSYNLRILPAYWNSTAVWNTDHEPDNAKYLSRQIRTDGTIYHHTNAEPTDTDWMRFTAKAGVTYTFELSNEETGQYYFQVHNDAGDFSGNQNTSWTWTCQIAGTYYVTIWENGANRIGAFDFSITADMADDTVDIRNKDVWLYTDSVYGASGYALTFSSSHCAENLVWSSSDEHVAMVDGEGYVEAFAAGSAIITVTCADNGATDHVAVYVNADDYEDNNSRTTATPIDVGLAYQHHQLDPAGAVADQNDWIQFEAVEGHGYVIELSGESGGDVRFHLKDKFERRLISGSNENQVWTCPLSGTYYIHCYENGNDQWTGYTIRVLPAYWNGDAFWDEYHEPDHMHYLARQVWTDGTVYHYVNTSAGEANWVRFTAAAETVYMIAAFNEHQGDFRFRLFDQDQNALGGNNTAALEWVCPEDGIYYVRMDEGRRQVGSYDFSITAVAADYVVDVALDEVTLYADTSMADYPLTATCSTANCQIRWQSEDISVVTVDQDGSLHAVGPGTSVVSAICTINGSDYYSDTISITVHSIEENMVAHYPFEGSYDDMSGNGLHPDTNGSMALGTDRFGDKGKASFFDGVDDYLTIASDSLLNPRDQLTITFWAKRDNVPAAMSPIVHKGGERTSGYTNREYSVWLRDDGSFMVSSAGDDSGHRMFYSSIAQVETWTFFAVVIDRRNHRVRIFLNDTFDREYTDNYSSFNTNENEIRIGWTEEVSGTFSHFSGTLDDIRIYDRALSNYEISSLYRIAGPAASDVLLKLKKGFNLISLAADSLSQPDLRDWLPVLGGEDFIEKVMAYDGLAGRYVTLVPGAADNPAYMLEGGEGLIVYAKEARQLTLSSASCAASDLRPGMNLVGVACPPEGFSAYDLLDAIGVENIVSVQCYNRDAGAFETAGFNEDGHASGADFPIMPGEGYFLQMKSEVSGFFPE